MRYFFQLNSGIVILVPVSTFDNPTGNINLEDTTIYDDTYKALTNSFGVVAPFVSFKKTDISLSFALGELVNP